MRFRARLPQIRWMQDTESLRGHPVESRVAQRVFSLFLVCSFAPVLALSTIVFLQVRSELKHQAESHLHGQSKGAGMAIADRLRVLDGQLASIEGSIERIGTLPPIGNLSAQDEPQSLAGIALLAGDGQVLQSEGRLGVIPPLDADDRAHLDGGRACLLSRARPDDRSVLYLFRKLESAAQAAAARTRPAEPGATPAGADRRVDVPVYLTARLDPDYLFSGEGFVSPPIELFALDKGGNLVFSSTGEIPEEELREAGYGTQSAGRFEWKNGDVDLFGAYWTLFMGYDFNTQWTLVHSEPRADVFAPLDRFRLVFILVMLLTFLVVISLSLMQIRRQLVPLHQLQTATRSLARGDLASRVSIRTNDEFAQLGSAFNQMATSIERSFDVIRSSNEIGISLTREKDVQRLLELVAEGAQHIVDADGAVIYIVTDEERLVPCVARVRSLALDRLSELEGVAGEEDRPLEASLAKVQDLHGSMIRRGDASDLPGKRLLQRLEQTHAYQVRDVLSIPLRDHDDEFIGVMQLINPRREGSEGGFSEEAVSAAESLASQCAVALTKSRLLDGFKGLFEGLTDLIATAIDEKSPYTYGHCQRVPVLTMMIAEAACQVQEGPFRDYTLTDDELYELKVAALLHDCGKVVTPVHVVDKATKLETIHDRIDLVATRFEIARRDREIARLRSNPSAPADPALTPPVPDPDMSVEAWQEQLEADLAFLRHSNFGSEFMPPPERERVQQIADRYQIAGPDGGLRPILTQDEVYNLTIPKGTLTNEERGVINEHVVATVKMLEKLPYPKKLRNVPFLAGAHHEKIDGSGYPDGLKGDDLPIRAQIIGLADIFEALTAKDRPYKPGRTLQEALGILGKMMEQGQIDKTLFDLFVGQKLHLVYARDYLEPAQIDIADPDFPDLGAAQAA